MDIDYSIEVLIDHKIYRSKEADVVPKGTNKAMMSWAAVIPGAVANSTSVSFPGN